MALITWADIVGFAPELSALTAGQQGAVVDQVNSEVLEANFGSTQNAKIAALWLGAHLGTLMKRGGANAPLQSVSVGGVSKTYAVSVAADASVLQSTSYGKEYSRLVRIRAPRIAVL